MHNTDKLTSENHKNCNNHSKAGKGESIWFMAGKRLIKNKSAMIGISIVFFLGLLAIFAPLIIPYDYTAIDIMNACKGPSLAHLFGTDDLGRDIFSRIIYGGRYSLRIGIITVAMSMTVGVTIGSISGYCGGTIDLLIMRALDILSSIPGMLLSIVISAVLGAGLFNTCIALAIGGAAGYARLVRSQILAIRGQEYLEAARAINCTDARIIIKQILPNVLSPIVINATMQCANTLLAAAALSYIGLGVQPPEPEWGAMLSAAHGYIRTYPYMLVFPGLMIMITVLSLNMFGDGLNDALDPKLKK